MDTLWEKMKLPLEIGVGTAIFGGVVNYVTKINTTVTLNFQSMFRSFLLVTTAGTATIYALDKYNERPGPS